MNLVEQELRDYLRTGLVVPLGVAGAGTTTTNIHTSTANLKIGDNIENITRASGKVPILDIVDANNLTVATITGQIPGDTLQFYPIKHWYVGSLRDEFLPINYLPLVAIHGSQSNLIARELQGDKYSYNMIIQVYTNAFESTANADVPDDILQAQKQLRVTMEDRNLTTNQLTLFSILGLISHQIANFKYFLFTDQYKITYDDGLIKGKIFFRATLTIRCVSPFIQRL